MILSVFYLVNLTFSSIKCMRLVDYKNNIDYNF